MNEKNLLYRNACVFLKPILKFSYKLTIKGEENVPDNGAVILCPNHTSNVDPILLAISTKRNICFMAKTELFKNKIFAALLKKLNVFPVNRKFGSGVALKTAENILKNRGTLGIFFEGSRSKTGKLLRPKSGASLLSIKTNSPILPVSIFSTSNSGAVKAFKKTTLEFGKMIFPEEIVDFGTLKTSNDSQYRNNLRSSLKQINEIIVSQIRSMQMKLVSNKN